MAGDILPAESGGTATMKRASIQFLSTTILVISAIFLAAGEERPGKATTGPGSDRPGQE
jgi:hypothetical protein